VRSEKNVSATEMLAARLASVRNAIQLYAAEHGGIYPGPDADDFQDALTTYTDLQGQTGTAEEARFAFRRYLVSVPPCPVGEHADSHAAHRVLISNDRPLQPDPAAAAGWAYNPQTGEFIANTGQSDGAGRPFSDY
jgi:hypothetical protein